MSWLARGLALPTRRLFLHHGNSGPIHLHIQDGHRLADDDGQIQLQGFLDLSLLALGDIGSDGLCSTLHGFGGHLRRPEVASARGRDRTGPVGPPDPACGAPREKTLYFRCPVRHPPETGRDDIGSTSSRGGQCAPDLRSSRWVWSGFPGIGRDGHIGTATDADQPPELRIAAVRLRRQHPLGGAQPARPTLRPPDPSARPYGVVQRHGRAVGLLPAPPPDGPQQPFFFLLGPAAPLRLDRAESTDLVVEGDQVLAKLLEAMKLGDLLLRLAQRRGIGKALRYRLAGDAASEAKLRIMSRVVVFGAVAGRFAAAPGHGGNGTRSKITQVEELLQELGSLGFQSCEIVRHRGLLSVSYLICTYRYVQNNATKKGNPQDASSRSRTNPDAAVYGVALLLSIVSGFLFGAVPVKQVLRTDPYQVIKSGSTGSVGRRLTVRDLLLGAQIAICAVLVTSSMVAVRGLAHSLHSNFGFDSRDPMLVDIDLNMAGYKPDRVPAMQKRMLEAMASISGVKSVGLVNQPPLQPACCSEANIFNDKTADLRPTNAAAHVIMFSISPEYLQAAGTPLLSGRDLTWHDDKNAPRVAVVNRLFASRMFGSATNALGGYYKLDDGTRIQVVGVVEDGKYSPNITEDPRPAMFLPILQSPSTETWLAVRSTGNPHQLAAAIRSKLRDLDAGLPTFVQTWNQAMDGALFPSRIAAVSLGILGVMGSILSVTGIFGLAAYSVSKRLRELGIRMALGAQRKEVLQAALGRALKLLAFGSAAGLLLGILASRVLAFIVYQATPRDPLVLAGTVLAMSLLGLVATWIPAQRALSIDPMILLREE